jgi:hypothetical protein
MKKQLLLLSLLLSSILTRAQFMPGYFINNLGEPYTTVSMSPCAVDSSFYVIRYGGVEQYTAATATIHYLWDRFYDATAIKAAPSSSLALLKGGLVYRYFPTQDSMVNISGSLPAATVKDIDASANNIWAIVAFDELGRYDSSGWHILSMGSSVNASHILAQSDTSAYIADGSAIRLYTPQGLSASIYSYSTLTDWSVDTAGNLWILADGNFTQLSTGLAATVYTHANSTLNPGAGFIHFTIDAYSTVWAATSDMNLLRYRGGSWTGYGITLPQPVQSMAADKGTGQVYLQTWDTIYVAPNGLFSKHDFGNMPYQQVSAVSMSNIATDQGIYTYRQNSNPYLVPQDFHDSISHPYANQVTCFVTGTPTGNQSDTGYGTHHGVYNTLAPINNAALPDTNINYLYYAMGSYYIGTDKGLCIYNQVVYTNFDTSNSALPSNKITYIISYQSPYTSAQELWVGTDRGVALYTNGLWTRFDTSVIHTQSFYVTGILPCPYVYMAADSTVWVSTLGSGLVKLKRDNTYKLLNTSNGLLADDSLYYVTQVSRCGYVGSAYIGTQHHGIAYMDISNNSFIYDTTGYNYYGYGGPVTFHKSNMYATIQNNYGQAIFTTDRGIVYFSICVHEGIESPLPNEHVLIWYQENGEELRVQLPVGYTGPTAIEVYDMTGRKAGADNLTPQADSRAYLDISSLPAGVYVLRAVNGGTTTQTKIVISK